MSVDTSGTAVSRRSAMNSLTYPNSDPSSPEPMAVLELIVTCFPPVASTVPARSELDTTNHLGSRGSTSGHDRHYRGVDERWVTPRPDRRAPSLNSCHPVCQMMTVPVRAPARDQ